MAKVQNGDSVKIYYVGKYDDGSVFSSTMDEAPIQFTLGQSEVMEGLQESIVGMSPGESKTVEIPADKAFGPYRNELVQKIARNQLREDIKPEVGEQLEYKIKNGESVAVTVLDATESSVTIDANHPLAGKVLTFIILLKEIV